MQRLLIDMDDVLADASQRFLDLLAERKGIKLRKEDTLGHDWYKGLPYTKDELRGWLWEDGFFRNMSVIPDSQRVVEALNQQYEVFIVSAATEFPNSLKEKMEWMAEHFPFISWKNIVLCGHKYMIQADYLIDDHEKNLKVFTGKPLIFTAPHNTEVEGYTRVNNWLEVEKLLL
jgi:5'-nucleotidase